MSKKKSGGLGRRSACPVACALDLVGDKWTLLVIRDLVLGMRHFEEFLDSPEKIATNILTDRLKQLEAGGYIVKTTDSSDRRKSIYELTDRGKELKRLMLYVGKWGLKNIPNTEAKRGKD